MKLSLILQAIDRISGPTRKAKASIDELGNRGFRGLTAKVEQARVKVRAFVNDTERGERVGRRFGTQLREIANRDFAAFVHGARRAQAAAGGLLRNLQTIGRVGRSLAIAGAVRGAGGLVRGALSVARYSALGAGAAAGAGASLFVRGVITQGSANEDATAELTRIEKSAARAAAGLAWVQKFARTSPLAVADLTEAFIEARRAGIDPASGSFAALQDKAVDAKKSIADAVEAMADARRGKFDGLDAFDISASKSKGMVSFTYLDREGKRATRSVVDNAAKVEKALTTIFQLQSGGAAEAKARTLGGLWQRIKNYVADFERKTASAGIFDRVKGGLDNILRWVDKVDKDGRLDAWAKRASDKLEELWNAAERFITQTNWNDVADGIGTIVSTLSQVISFIGAANSAWMRWHNNMERQRLNEDINRPGFLGTGWGGASPQEKAKARARLQQLDREQYGQPQAQNTRSGGVVWPEGTGGKGSPGSGSPWRRSSTTGTTAGQALMLQRGFQPPPPPPGPVKPGKVDVSITLKGPAAGSATVGRVQASGPVNASVNRGWAMGLPQ